MTDPIPAATLAIFRESDDGAPDLLFVERAGGMAFAAGALVFPGGRVDPDDHAIAAGFSALDPEDAAARVAAIRETLEETGLAIGFVRLPDADEAGAMRAALEGGETFGAILARGGWTLDLDALVPWARWCPSFRESRNFDTRFYLARLPDGAHPATVDQTENVHLFWAPAQAVLDRAARGEVHLIFPTRRNLERIAHHGNFAAAAAHAAQVEMRMIQPWIEARGGEDWLCIPEDQGYPVTCEPLAAARRG